MNPSLVLVGISLFTWGIGEGMFLYFVPLVPGATGSRADCDRDGVQCLRICHAAGAHPRGLSLRPAGSQAIDSGGLDHGSGCDLGHGAGTFAGDFCGRVCAVRRDRFRIFALVQLRDRRAWKADRRPRHDPDLGHVQPGGGARAGLGRLDRRTISACGRFSFILPVIFVVSTALVFIPETAGA